MSAVRATSPADPLLRVEGLRVSIRTDEGAARILDHIDLTVGRGRILGIVGESGCGKSTLIRSILGILPRGAKVDQGEIRLDGENLLGLSQQELSQRIRGKSIGFIPQDPYLAFNPVFRVGTQLLEIMRWHAPVADEARRRRLGRADREGHRRRLVELLRVVQIPDPEAALERYPHQFSGGQRQRLLIAAALSCSARLVIADEPTTALDVTTQLQILKLLRRLADEFGISMLFVTHDFGVVAQLCDDVTVMYAGQSVESGTVADILDNARHPYTQRLIGCHPDRSVDLSGIPGMVPSPLSPPPGCRFHPRCPSASDECRRTRPEAVIEEGGHLVNCVLYQGAATRG